MPKLLHEQQREVFGDQTYWNDSHRKAALAAGIRYRINRRSGARARVEHVLHAVKRLWGFGKVHYGGLAKNIARLYTISTLARIYWGDDCCHRCGFVPFDCDDWQKTRENTA